MPDAAPPTPARNGRIRVLPPLVANQIAAGEVVERPASVVKELLENAIDAGATRILVELEAGGIELVRVTDDGRGIAPDDLPLAVAAHATSKISDVTDLDHIATLGFRGEALASIASVSRVSIRSRQPDADPTAGAWVIDAAGDHLAGPRPAPGPVGTCVSVRTLFFNTPARRKFLRTPGTEQDHAAEAVRRVALAHPGVGFILQVDSRTLLDVPAGQSPRRRAVAVLGPELESQVVEVHADRFDDPRGLALWGLAGLPSIARATAKHQFVFVNGRAVRDRTIQHALAEAYRGLIEPGRYPTLVLMLELSPQGVDVNVHPAKAEVRFRDASLVHSTVYNAVRRALQSADLTPTASALRPAFAGPPHDAPADPLLPGSGLPSGPQGSAPFASVARFVEHLSRPTLSTPGFRYDQVRDALAALDPASPSTPAPPQAAAMAFPPAAAAPVAAPAPTGRVLQVHNSYLVTQDEQGVVIIDQHALHERVMFEYLLDRVAAGPLESQHLLAPAVVSVRPELATRLPELAALLARIGIRAEPLSPGSVGIHEFPSFLFDRNVDPVDFLTSLLDKLDAGAISPANDRAGEEALRDVLDMMACKAAVKAGDRLGPAELAELVTLRDHVERASNCPHGRPTSVRLTLRELERLFGRA